MDGESSGAVPSGDKRQARLAILLIGIALFVLGFVITVSSSSGLGDSKEGNSHGVFSTGADTSSLSLLVLVGIVISLAGVLVATVGPMASFIQAKTK